MRRNSSGAHPGPICPVYVRLLLSIVLLTLTPPLLTAQDHCDPGLRARPGDPLGYGLTSDRCEGIYVQEVSGTALAIVSLTAAYEAYDLGSGEPLMLEWASPADSDGIQLRALSLRPREYYRMDSVRSSSESSFAWPVSLLGRVGLSREELGVVAWTRTGVAEDLTYLPLTVRQSSDDSATGDYDLVILPGRELDEVYLSIATTGGEGQPADFLTDGEALALGFYPAGRPFTVPIGELPAEGVYFVEIGAVLRGGGSADLSFRLYHSVGAGN